MRFKRSHIVLILILPLLTYLIFGYIRSWNEERENTRLENILSPTIDKTVEGTQEPKPSLYFVSATRGTVVIVIQWRQKPEAPIKNDMRERVSYAVRRELAADPNSWGKHVSVTFDDEVVTQSWK